MIFMSETVDVDTKAGVIRCLVARPRNASATQRYRAVVLYSDIFQLTPPMVRTVARLAGHGFVVVAPELYCRIEKPGTVLDFDRDRQRALDDADKMPVAHLDEDRRAVLDWVKRRDDVTNANALGVAGWCFGGHLAFRAAMEADVKATMALYGTGIHNGKLGASSPTSSAGSLERAKEIHGALHLVWGENDPHIPLEGREKIHAALQSAGTSFNVTTYAGAEHAFMRDEGPRYDPEATDAAFSAMIAFFKRELPG